MQWNMPISRDQLYEIAEYAVTALALLFGWRYLKEIIAMVMIELHRLLIQRGYFSV